MTGDRYAFEAIGTAWSITTDGPVSSATRDRIATLIDGFDLVWSRFRADSAVTRLAREGGEADLGPDAAPMLELLLALAARTAGRVTPLIGASLEHLGYDADYRLVAGPGHRPAPSAELLRVAGERVRLAEPALIDVGAVGKGRLVDLVAAELVAAGHRDAIVDASGDLAVLGAPVVVALEHPYDPTMAVGTAEVAGAAICASAVNRRSWDAPDGRPRLHHVLDGRTGEPVQEIAATWAVAPTAMLADGLATALFFLEPDDAAAVASSPDVHCLRMTTDGRVRATAGFPGELFTAAA